MRFSIRGYGTSNVRTKIFQRFRSAGLIVGLLIVLGCLVLALLGPIVWKTNPLDMDTMHIFEAPSAQFPFGTDQFGRDVFARTMAGMRLSLAIAGGGVIVGALLGVLTGLVGGYYRGRVNTIIMGVTDTMLAFPPIIIALSVIAFWGTGTAKLLVVIALSYTPRFTRLVNGSVLGLSGGQFVEAARALGASEPRVLFRHILPNIWAPIIVELTLGIGTAVLTEAGLGYLGLGTPPPHPSLGAMISASSGYLSFAPWMLAGPSAALCLTIIGLNLLGDGLRDAFDPRTS